jgi:CrcB protein
VIAGRDGRLPSVLFAVGLGAVLGASLRWALAYWLNPRVAHLPPGTLAAGRRLPRRRRGGRVRAASVGVAVLAAAAGDRLPRRTDDLLDLLGENVALMVDGARGSALAHAAAHLVGSLLATAAGIATVRLLA